VKRVVAFIAVGLFSCLFLFSMNPFSYPVETVFIDPGHGGQDSGAVRNWDFAPGGELMEKDVNLAISLILKDYLKQKAPSLDVVLTRSDDTFPSLQERSQLCYRTVLSPKTASLFLSIHANASTNQSAEGFEVFTKPKDKQVPIIDEKTPLLNIPLFASEDNKTLNVQQMEENLKFAGNIESSLAASFPSMEDRGIKEDDLYVLNACRTCAALVEVGFISNREDALHLLDPAWQHNMAQALGDAILKYVQR
jgi:N-acetylmuramoyl-L-alanine amidase